MVLLLALITAFLMYASDSANLSTIKRVTFAMSALSYFAHGESHPDSSVTC